jgi:phospholipid/cholesterol/gamma-HCH transport system permease protein
MQNEDPTKSFTFFGRIFWWLGSVFLSTTPGKQTRLVFEVLFSIFSKSRNFRTDFRNVILQIFFTGVEIFPVLFVVATLFGTVIIIEALTVMPKVGFSDSFGSLMVIVVVRELGPILTAFLIAGRSGSALTAMIGSMEINSEVDALATMGVNPIRYLVMPALIGGIFALLIMNIIFSISGICAGFLTTKALIAIAGNAINVQISWHYLSSSILTALTPTDFVMTIVKPVVFAFIIVINACYQGLTIRRDVRQVPKATSRSVIYSFLYIVIADVVLSVFYIFQYFNEVSKII